MLVLTRRIEETLVIGERVTVTVLNVKGDRVRLGVTAPREVPVRRSGNLASTAFLPPCAGRSRGR